MAQDSIVRYGTPINKLEYAEWAEIFQPVESSSLNNDDGFDGCLFSRRSTAAVDESVINPHNVWTIIRENGHTLILEGYRGISNCIGYLITRIPYEAMRKYEVSYVRR